MADIEFVPVAADDPRVVSLLGDYERELVTLGVVLNHGSSGGTTPGQFMAPRGHFALATQGDEVLGCGGIRMLDEDSAELKRMYVVPLARGRGLARRLLLHLETVGAQLGATRARLDTGADMAPAVALYRSADYREIADYNGNSDAGWWFEKSLV